jgi:TolA-binding protein
LGRVYFAQKKYEEAAIAMAEFNSVFPNDSRFQETTLIIAEAAVNFSPKNQLCDILQQSLEFMVNPSKKFVKRINSLKNEKQCSAE